MKSIIVHPVLRISQALNHIKDPMGLILDIRHDKGGPAQHVETIFNRIFTSTPEKPDSYWLGEQTQFPPFKPQVPVPHC